MSEAPVPDISESRPGGPVRIALLLFLSCYVLGCGLWIDVLNRRAGGILPRMPDADGRIAKWRVAAETPMRMRPARFPPEEIERASRNRELRSAVESFGLTQYLFGPLAVILGSRAMIYPARFPGMDRAVGGFAIVAGAIGLYLAWTRQYLGSLGW